MIFLLVNFVLIYVQILMKNASQEIRIIKIGYVVFAVQKMKIINKKKKIIVDYAV